MSARKMAARSVMTVACAGIVPAVVGSHVDPWEDRPVVLWAKGLAVLAPVLLIAWAQQELTEDRP